MTKGEIKKKHTSLSPTPPLPGAPCFLQMERLLKIVLWPNNLVDMVVIFLLFESLS